VIKEISIPETTAFLLFFPSLSSGPIDRSRRFHQDWDRVLSREAYMELCAKGIWKLLLGAVYKMVIAAGAYKLMGYLDTGNTWYILIGYAYAYGMYLFFDFAGYSLMAVGSAYILGVELPDNFNMPFLSVDIREFWDRWHITLSHWFRDFIFTRFIMYSAKKKWFSDRLKRACVGFLVNMGIMGVWHGISWSYILYGLYHGLLLAGTEVYQKKSKFYKKHKTEKWYRVLSWAVTMQFVMFGFFLFSGKLLALFG
jgi:membrane protein involved in D-alanine export